MNRVEEVRRLVDEESIEEFNKRVWSQVEDLKELVGSKRYLNKEFSIGLELETYVLNENDLINPIPSSLFNNDFFSPEIGVQNIEINTRPNQINLSGFLDQKNHLLSKFEKSNDLMSEYGSELVLDSLSTNYKDALEFFSSVKEIDGLVFAENMSKIPRYHAIDNAVLEKRNNEIEFKVPGIKRVFPSLLFESLTTSLQVHLQIPAVEDFTDYYNMAIKTLPPLLALSTNSPLLPPSFYENGLPENIFHENRIPIFEQCIHPYDTSYEEKKVRFPKEIDKIIDLVKEVAEDETYSACLKEWVETDSSPQRDFWEWDYKLREFWRWIRPVIGGEDIKNCCSEHSLRIEYRPLPTQPTIKENLSLQMITAGLIHGLVIKDHPVIELDWGQSKKDFYEAMKNGLNAELNWITKDREDTTDKDIVFNEIFDFAKTGLRDFGIKQKLVEEFISPIKERWKKEFTPSTWKIERVKKKLSENKNLREAIFEVNKDYKKHSKTYNHFIEWKK